MINRKYNRIFILMNGKNEGESAGINGSCDIEIINGSVRLYSYVGGLGRLRNKKRNLYLLSVNDNETRAVSAGEFTPKGGNAVLEVSVDADNVFGSGMKIEEINGAAVWCEGENSAKAILEGYISKRINKNVNVKIFGEEKNEVKKTEAEEKKTLQAAEAFSMDYSPHDTFRAISERFRRELEMLDELGIVDKRIILGDKEEADKEIELKTAEEISPLDDIFMNNEKILNSGNVGWVKADLREAYLLPIDIRILRSVFVKNSARKGRHIIIGRDSDKYYIGVPGIETMKSKAEENGFYDFFTLEGMNGHGYWIREV